MDQLSASQPTPPNNVLIHAKYPNLSNVLSHEFWTLLDLLNTDNAMHIAALAHLVCRILPCAAVTTNFQLPQSSLPRSPPTTSNSIAHASTLAATIARYHIPLFMFLPPYPARPSQQHITHINLHTMMQQSLIHSAVAYIFFLALPEGPPASLHAYVLTSRALATKLIHTCPCLAAPAAIF